MIPTINVKEKLELYKNHRIKKLGDSHWFFAEPGTLTYSTTVLLSRSRIIIYGDLGDHILAVWTNNGPQLLSWLRGVTKRDDATISVHDINYFCGKYRTMEKEFNGDLTKENIMDQVKLKIFEPVLDLGYTDEDINLSRGEFEKLNPDLEEYEECHGRWTSLLNDGFFDKYEYELGSWQYIEFAIPKDLEDEYDISISLDYESIVSIYPYQALHHWAMLKKLVEQIDKEDNRLVNRIRRKLRLY
ncbi:hypothetical protein LCGC14_0195450 [marine sediment metagenome]|uniref:Uncharacterized protein n=1 Tax=marine sediment metagenome TaxID=412755 RepID=A0A0F9V1W6_9ZZZZ